MTSLLFAMVACFAVATGARDQLLVAQLRARLGPSKALLAVALACAVASAALAAWFGSLLGSTMSSSASTMFGAFALLAAAFELLWPNRVRRIEEPTRSLGAIAIVLLARQVTDASRFLVAAFALALPTPALAGLGGAIGGGAAITMGWLLGASLERRLPLRAIRIVLGVIVLAIAIVTGLSARGLIG